MRKSALPGSGIHRSAELDVNPVERWRRPPPDGADIPKTTRANPLLI